MLQIQKGALSGKYKGFPILLFLFNISDACLLFKAKGTSAFKLYGSNKYFPVA